MSSEQGDSLADHAQAPGNEDPHWRSRMYGRCRAADRNRLAWFFADRRGRVFLRDLRQAKRQQRQSGRS